MKVHRCNQSAFSGQKNMHILPACLPKKMRPENMELQRNLRFPLTENRQQFTKADHFCVI